MAGGCAILPAQSEDKVLTGETHLEKLLAEQEYQKARQLLPQLATELDPADYEAKQRLLSALIDKLETETAGLANDLSAREKPAEALKVVDGALEKIPASTRLLDLRNDLRRVIERRRNLAQWNLLISRMDYLNAQLRGYRELARLKEPSWLYEWRLAAIGDAIANLGPDLLACGRQARLAAENKVADRCLQLAGEIDASKIAGHITSLGRNSGNKSGADGESETDLTPILEPQASIKKFKPTSPSPGSSREELEDRLSEEISREDLSQGYATLAELAKIPEAAEQCGKYKDQLDRIRDRQIAKFLDAAAVHYRGGRIAQAREYWLKVLELDPDNTTARDRIARADRVLKKLHDLQEAQQKPNPPK